jgi:putative phosphoribosyl transferase
MLAVDDDFIKAEAVRQLAVIERREALYRRGRPAEPVTGRTAILVDDGIATGWTMQAAIRAVKRAAPKRIVIAVPVAAPRTVADLRRQVDEVVCVMAPPDLGSIGRFYRDFSQVEDREVVAMLEKQ